MWTAFALGPSQVFNIHCTHLLELLIPPSKVRQIHLNELVHSVLAAKKNKTISYRYSHSTLFTPHFTIPQLWLTRFSPSDSFLAAPKTHLKPGHKFSRDPAPFRRPHYSSPSEIRLNSQVQVQADSLRPWDAVLALIPENAWQSHSPVQALIRHNLA